MMSLLHYHVFWKVGRIFFSRKMSVKGKNAILQTEFILKYF